jgi:D-galactarolactone cycloisomerase
MKVTDVRTVLLSHSLPEGKRIRSDFGVKHKFDLALVVVETDAGLTGYGEAGGTPIVMKTIVEEHLKPLLVGEDPTRLEYLWERMYSGSRLPLAQREGRSMPVAQGRRGEGLCALSGVDLALWDLWGKHLNQPVYKLLGGAVRERIPCYASGGWQVAKGAQAEMAAYRARGFRAAKMRVGGMDRDLGESLERIAAARAGLGEGIPLMLDAHGSMTPQPAIRLARRAEAYGIAFFEEPVSPDDVSGLALVRREGGLPVAAGEQLFTRWDFRDHILAGAMDILQPDLAWVGGLTEARRVAALASVFGLTVAPHVWGSAVLFLASLHWAAALHNLHVFEYPVPPEHPLQHALVTPTVPEPGPDGCLPLPPGPGFGFQIGREAAQRYPFRPGWIMDL